MDIKPIRTPADHAAALKEIERLWERAQPGTPAGEKFEGLSTLVVPTSTSTSRSLTWSRRTLSGGQDRIGGAHGRRYLRIGALILDALVTAFSARREDAGRRSVEVPTSPRPRDRVLPVCQ